jgi:hypothetical protein
LGWDRKTLRNRYTESLIKIGLNISKNGELPINWQLQT